ncbi:enoyl-CoA hydratase/isomerase family protein [Altererythrobacter sp. CC-YST694]|uniref:enoyl-CoA hydratase-related protein n=1 Tax=Altererythrobacter sp. CC-YST694 TaxID=2755038 RepID=UPI001D01B1F9|nr:enoyl-CoA hydratase-related protein [Altererythrobacter sp. CC-YST694]MCB5424689.1 enoyl-CoA hydratase/isomerase family protein [Altererythrobacter sp. CC-YST694]
MAYQFIRFEIAGTVATLTLARPDKLNALTQDMADEMRHALSNTGAARAVLIRGEGRAFCSGADLSAILGEEDAGEGAYRSLVDHYNPLVMDIAEHRLPIVAEVNGAAAGIGCSIALACDFCLAGQGAYFLQAFVNIGLVPDGGASWILPRLIGKARAAEMLMLGEKVPAGRAAEWGLIHRCVEDAELADEAQSLAVRLAAGPTAALGLMKANLYSALHHSYGTVMDAEAAAQREAAGTHDAKEGIGAFLGKRAPQFRGE